MEQKRKIQHWQVINIFLYIYDYIAILVAYSLVLWLRFDCRISLIPNECLRPCIVGVLIYAAIALVIFTVFRLYKFVWHYASYNELERMIIATVILLFVNIVVMNVVTGYMNREVEGMHYYIPISCYIAGIIIQLILTIGVRFAYRFVRLVRRENKEAEFDGKRIMLIGAGAAGHAILRDSKISKEVKDKICCIIDDDPNKWKRYIDGVPVVGDRNCIIGACKKYHIEKIYYAIPSADAKTDKEIFGICKETGCEIKKLPGMYQFMTDQVSVAEMKDVQVDDLLGRDPVKVNRDEIFAYLQGKVIMVTGGGGSIGSELCRQIAAHLPKQLIIFEIYENNAYEIQNELKRKYPELKLEVIIGSVRDSRKMFDVMEKYHPQVVYHTAAHKHVPLMEDSPCEAIKNNAIGTYKTAYAAMIHGCERFVLISTDKAVNPTNIMGASKRLCEMIIQSMDAMVKCGKAEELPQLYTHPEKNQDIEKKKALLKNAKTEFVAVRFGNVLGSNGSVIPLFKKQIKEGGPVTVTHPEIIRYFMTISEAASLVLQAGNYAQGGEIFVLDMGEPVKIDTLARNLIKLSGHKPDVDIKVIYTGLRPGEKLYEEKLLAEEGLKKTENELIHIGCPIPFDTEEFLQQLRELMNAAYKNKTDIKERVARVVTTYHPS